MSPSKLSDFEFLLFDGFSNMVLASAMEPLRDTKLRARRRRANWTVSTVDGQPAASSSGIKIMPDQAFNAASPAKRLILVAGYHARELASPELSVKLRQAARHAELIIALDTASWLLGFAGLLDQRQASIHWQERAAFSEAFPEIDVSHAGYVQSGPFLTCGGANSTFDMMLGLIRDLFGDETAFDASTMFINESPVHYSQSETELRLTGSSLLLACFRVMVENIEVPLSSSALAKYVGTPERTLHREFKSKVGLSPGKFYQMFRLKHARHLAEETELSLAQIALRCGFSSAPSLCRAYKDTFGATLRAKN